MVFTFLVLIKPLYIEFLLLVCVEIRGFYLSVSYETTVYKVNELYSPFLKFSALGLLQDNFETFRNYYI